MSLRIWSAIVVATLVAGCSCDDGLVAKDTPSFRADPTSFAFGRLAAGEVEERRIEIFNDGEGALLMGDFSLVDNSSAGEFVLLVEMGGALVEPPDTLEIPGGTEGEPVVLVVRYAAVDGQPDSGEVRIRTNDDGAGEDGDVTLPITSGTSGGEILIEPRTVDFGEVEAGQEKVEAVSISNVGGGELTVTRLQINGDGEFTVRYDGEPVGGDLSPPLVIASNASVKLDVVYAPARLGADGGELVVHSDDPVEAAAVVTLVANGAAPCITVTPSDVDFGSSLIIEDRGAPTPNKRPISIESCGTTPLRVSRIDVMDADGAFEMVELPEVEDGEPLFVIPAAAPDETGALVFPAELATVGFWPTEMRAYGGTAFVHSNALSDPVVEVSLFGRGVQNACPIPAVRTEQYNVPPLEIVTLDGTPSMDPGGAVERYEWTVISRPDGSVSNPVEVFEDPTRPADGGLDDDTSTPTAFFFVDLAGDYEIELRVYDNLGQVSCDPNAVARVFIHAVPDKDLHIQLVWTTPADPDETDGTGTDVDLHLRHPMAGGVWGHDQYDCYFRNSDPDWGVAMDPSDNPTLDIDDTNGAGPENINLSDPETGVAYDVGAIYFRAESTFGLRDVDPRTEHLSLVTVRVFARGDLLLEVVDRELDSVDDLWHVATITWCEDFQRCPSIDLVDEVEDGN